MRYFLLKQKIKQEEFHISFEKSKTVSFASSIMKSITALFARLSVKLICCIAFGSATSEWLFVVYLNLLLWSFEMMVAQQTTSFLIISFNLFQLFKYYHKLLNYFFIIFYFQSRKIISFGTCLLCFIFKWSIK